MLDIIKGFFHKAELKDSTDNLILEFAENDFYNGIITEEEYNLIKESYGGC